MRVAGAKGTRNFPRSSPLRPSSPQPSPPAAGGEGVLRCFCGALDRYVPGGTARSSARAWRARDARSRAGQGLSISFVLCLLNSYTLAAMDFWLRRGESDEHILQGSARSEQRSMSQKDMPPFGLRRFWALASLLLGHSPTSGDAPSSRLARTQNRCNQCIAIQETQH